MLNLYKLEIFNAVAMEGSFSRAARRLLLTQPAVSQHIRDLEESLGNPLFQRGARGVSLTSAGEVLLDYTRCILRMVAEAESAIAALSQTPLGPVTIGATPGVGVYLLPGWIRAFRQRYEHLPVTLRTDTTTRVAADLLAGRLNLGFVEGEIDPEPPLQALSLREISLCVVVGKSHSWWERAQVSIGELDGQEFIARTAGSHTRLWTDQLFTRHKVTPRIVAEFDNPEAIKQAVAAGMGIAILPDWTVADGWASGRAIPLQGIELRRTLKLLWSAGQPIPLGARAFLALLADQFPSLVQAGFPGDALSLRLPARDEYRASLDCRGVHD